MTTAVAFDFTERSLESLSVAEVTAAIVKDHFCWVDFEDRETAIAYLPELGVDDDSLARLELEDELCQARHSEHGVQCVLVEAQLAGTDLHLNPVHVFLVKNLIVTVHEGPSSLIESVRETYEHDFHVTAETGGFLIFELVDHLIIGYRETLAALTAGVDSVQQSLISNVEDKIFSEVTNLTRALLRYRNAVVTAREAIDELATRRTPYVQTSTQPFLDRQTLPLDRLAQDAAMERTVLSEALNLYMSLVGHRTNKVVNRLTVVSMIFLPLNFIAAVYGMNFKFMPELQWHFAYAAFWAISLLLVVALIVVFRRRRWI